MLNSPRVSAVLEGGLYEAVLLHVDDSSEGLLIAVDEQFQGSLMPVAYCGRYARVDAALSGDAS